MKVIVEMEIKTSGYNSRTFEKEIENLIAVIDKKSRLIKFTMYDKKDRNNLKDYK